MKNALIIVLIILWFTNTEIAYMLFPEASNDWFAYVKAIHVKHIFYELFILILIITYLNYKKNRFIFSLLGGFAVLVLCSIIDKITGVFTYAYSDIVVIIFSFFISIYMWNNYNKYQK